MSYIEIINMSKKIKKRNVLENITVSFEKGKIYGLYGRNGSGKTMLLRAVAGLIRPSEGEIFVDGKQLHKDISFPPSVGVIIEHTSLLPQFDAYTNLKNLSKIKKVASDEDIDRIGSQLVASASVADKTGHVDKIHASQEMRFERESMGLCPRCGAALVERTARKGPNAGSKFLGCSRYPECKYTKGI